MEVHHHPETERKNLKGYLLEGLMIFLAVTMGFFAESLRESINNKEKETEYISSLIHDLEHDTASLNNSIRVNQSKINHLDSLLALTSKTIAEPHNLQLLYKYSRSWVSVYSRFFSNDATMMQLKYSGGLQYIKHDHIADSIANYDQEVRSIYAAEAPYTKALNDAVDVLSELLVFRLKSDSADFENGSDPRKELPLLTHDPQKIEIFFNKIAIEQGWTQNYVNNLRLRAPITKRLIELLKNEYGLN